MQEQDDIKRMDELGDLERKRRRLVYRGMLLPGLCASLPGAYLGYLVGKDSGVEGAAVGVAIMGALTGTIFTFAISAIVLQIWLRPLRKRREELEWWAARSPISIKPEGQVQGLQSINSPLSGSKSTSAPITDPSKFECGRCHKSNVHSKVTDQWAGKLWICSACGYKTPRWD